MSARRLVASVPLTGFPEPDTLEDIQTVYELDGWRNVFVAAAARDDVWEAEVFADDDPNRTEPRRRLTVRDAGLAATGGAVLGLALGLGIILLAALGAVAMVAADWLGGWARLALWCAGAGAVGALVRAVVDPDLVRP